MQFFLRNHCLRESCYNCSQKGVDRVSDITLADFWGINNEIPAIDDNKGVSFVIIHSEKGHLLFNEIKNCRVQNVNLETGIKYNPSINSSPIRPTTRDEFYNHLRDYSFKKMIKIYANVPLIKRLCRLLKKGIKKLLK